MRERTVLNAAAPGIHLLAVHENSLANTIGEWMAAYPGWAIRRVRGKKASTRVSFMDEIGAALQLPDYFGENWDALFECIRDFSWIREPNKLVVFERADLLLTQSDDDFGVLLKLLNLTNAYWRELPNDVSVKIDPIGFQSVLSCPTDAYAGLKTRVESTGIPFASLNATQVD